MSRKREPASPPIDWAPLALGIGTFALYALSLKNGLTNWDDPEYVTHNPIASQDWKGILAAFTTPYDASYYPLTHATYAWVHALGGGATALHLLQATLFALTVALVPQALKPFGVLRPASVWVALLWAIHPMRVESVSWAANLKDTLGAALVVGSFAAFAASRRRLALGLFAAGLLAKSAFFPLAVLFPLAGTVDRRSLRSTWPFLVVAAAVAGVAGALHLGGPISSAPHPLGERVSTALWTPWWYLGRILWPVNPRELYDFALVTPGSFRFFAALGLWLLLAAAVALSPRAFRRPIVLATVAYVLALIPVGGLIPLKHPVADRYTLFPSLALLAALAALLSTLSARRAAAGVAIAAALVLVPLNLVRQGEWSDSISLWESNQSVTHASTTLELNLANAYGEAGRWEDAERATEAALRLEPARVDLLGQLFLCTSAVDKVPVEDFSRLRASLQSARFDGPSRVQAAEWCLSNGYLHSARALLEHGSGPDDPRQQRMLSVVARRQSRFAEAVELAQAAVAKGEPKARIELTYALADAKRFDEALETGSIPLAEPYAAAQLRGAHAYALVQMGRGDEGRLEARAALEEIQSLAARQTRE